MSEDDREKFAFNKSKKGKKKKGHSPLKIPIKRSIKDNEEIIEIIENEEDENKRKSKK